MAWTLGCTVAELEERLMAAELSEWAEFFQEMPWGPEADFYRTGLDCATMLNIHRDPKRKPRPWQPMDFMPKVKQTVKEPVSGSALKAKFLEAFAGKIKHGRTPNLHDQGRQGDGEGAKGIRPAGGIKARRQGIKGRSAANRSRGKKTSP